MKIHRTKLIKHEQGDSFEDDLNDYIENFLDGNEVILDIKFISNRHGYYALLCIGKQGLMPL